MSSDQTDQTDPANPFAPPEHSTSARNLLTVALQVLGFWLVCRSLIELPHITVYAMYGSQRLPIALTMILRSGAPLVVGVAVILLAGRISRRFYPASDRTADPIAFGRVGAGDLYHVASYVLGIYFLVTAAGYAINILRLVMENQPAGINLWTGHEAVMLLTASIYSVTGLILIFGCRGIAQAMSAVPRDSDEVPVPQFSIRMLLILGVAFAIVLGVLRAVIVGIR